MFKKLDDKQRKRLKRKIHIRKRISGTAARPRLTVSRSNSNLSMQAIDDVSGTTLVSISTVEKDLRATKPNTEGAMKVGELMGGRLKEKNITTVVFDRNGYFYHGVIKALADGARKAGIEF